MDTKKEVLEFGKSKLNQWKGMIEELELQLSLGKAEAKDVIKEEQKNFSKFFNQQKAQFKKAETKMAEQRLSLARKLSELSGALHAEAPEEKRTYESRRKQIMKLVHEAEYLIRTVYKDASDTITQEFDSLKDALDSYRIQLALSEFTTREDVNASQNALMEALENAITFLDKENSKDGKSLQHFMDEISQSFDHLKQAFTEIIK